MKTSTQAWLSEHPLAQESSPAVMVNILFIALEFPPVNTTGNYRSLKFVKYLSTFGVNPVVITLDTESGSRIFGNKIDETLLEDIPNTTRIVRLSSHEKKSGLYNTRLSSFLRIYFNADDRIVDKLQSNYLDILDREIATSSPKAIYISLPPFSTGRLGVKLAKRYQLPLIVDMRDAWAFWGLTPFQTRLHFQRLFRMEKEVFQHAAKIIGVTPQLVEIFRREHPEIAAEKFTTITNGFDAAMEDDVWVRALPLGERKTFSIGYIGSFYFNPDTWAAMNKVWWKRPWYKKFYFTPVKEDWLYRTPYFFLQALQALLDLHPRLKPIIKFEYVGAAPPWLDNMVKDFGLQDCFVNHGFLSQDKVQEIQKRFDLVLSTSEKVENQDHYCLPSKIFDYVKSAKPVIGFVTKGIQRDFILASGIGQVCDPDDVRDGTSKLMSILDNGWQSKLNIEYLNQFNRQQLAGQLANLIKEIA